MAKQLDNGFFNMCFSCLLSPVTYLYFPKSTKCSLCITLNVKQTAFISVFYFNVSVGVKVNPKGRGDTDVQKNKIRGMQSSLPPQMYRVTHVYNRVH